MTAKPAITIPFTVGGSKGTSVTLMVKVILLLEKQYGQRAVNQAQWDRMVQLLGDVEQHWQTLEKAK